MGGFGTAGDGKIIYLLAYFRLLPSVVSKLSMRVVPMKRTALPAREDFPIAERRNQRCPHLRWFVCRERFLCALGALLQ